jgi:two-component system, NarL family, nitrate/nitrite response regulator NarL
VRGSQTARRVLAAPVARDSKMIRVLIFSDVRVYREGLAEVLDGRSGISISGTSAGGWESVDMVRTLGPDIVLLDMSTAGGMQLLREISARCGDTEVVALGVTDSEPEVVAYAEAGVAGYVTRNETLDELVQALLTVARGEAPCSPRAAAMLLQRVSSLAGGRSGRRGTAVHLTERERQILGLIGTGLSNKQIGQRLCIELPTVKNHVHHILEKLGVPGRHEAAQLSRELTLL